MGKPKDYQFWIAGNILIIVVSFSYIWIVRSHDRSILVLSQALAQSAMLFFLVNVNMYFIFLVIRRTKQRNVKIQLAKFSRLMMKWHIKIAVVGAIIIGGHAIINLFEAGHLIGYIHLKMVSGYFALCLLFVTLTAGYLRHRKASGFRRKFHLVTSMAFALIFLFHMFVYIR